MAEENPLVSIIVITYNSSKYVIETLESAKAQIYQNIELIVSDDCSTDNTVEICREWIEQNKERFVRTELLTSYLNTGVPANCNRGVKRAKGQWIKLIAGDDILLPEYLSTILDHRNQYSIICSNYYIADEVSSNIISKSNLQTKPYFLCSDASCQFQYALRIPGTVPPLTAIFKSEIYDLVGGYDENFRLIEDYPFFLKVNLNGIFIYCNDSYLAIYRKHSDSITLKVDYLIHPIFKETFYIQRKLFTKYLPYIEIINLYYKSLITNIFLIKFLNKKNKFIIFVWRFLNLVSILTIYRKILHLFRKNYTWEKYLKNY